MGNKLKILMVHPHDIYSASEPWTIRITHIAEEFVKMGHEVKLVYFPLPDDKRGLVLKEKHTTFKTIPFNRSKWSVPKNMFRMKELAEWADIIHFQKCFSIASIPSIFASIIKNKPIHYDWDDWEYAIYNWDPPSFVYGEYLNLMEKIVPKCADTISVASNGIRKLAHNLKIKDEIIFDSHVGADLDKFNPKNSGVKILKKYKIKKPLILYLGQIHGGQYAELFLKAAKILLDNKVEAEFMVVGGGEFLNELKRRNDMMGLKDKTIFTNFVKYNDVPQYIAAATVCVASFEDNNITRCKSPLKIVEYLASGKAIVASKVGEVPNMLRGCGIPVHPGDPESIAEGIQNLLEDTTLRETFQKRARQRAEEQYNWTVTAKNILNAYKLAIEIHQKKH